VTLIHYCQMHALNSRDFGSEVHGGFNERAVLERDASGGAFSLPTYGRGGKGPRQVTQGRVGVRGVAWDTGRRLKRAGGESAAPVNARPTKTTRTLIWLDSVAPCQQAAAGHWNAFTIGWKVWTIPKSIGGHRGHRGSAPSGDADDPYGPYAKPEPRRGTMSRGPYDPYGPYAFRPGR
jgi:hypothetical protein